MSKVKVLVKDFYTLELLEDAKAHDIIDLKSLQEVDLDSIRNLIDQNIGNYNKEEYANKLNAMLLEQENLRIVLTKDYDAKLASLDNKAKTDLANANSSFITTKNELVKEYDAKINELSKQLELNKAEKDNAIRLEVQTIEAKAEKAIIEANNKIKTRETELNGIYKDELHKLADSKAEEINSLKTQITLLTASLDSKIRDKQNELELKYQEEITKLKGLLELKDKDIETIKLEKDQEYGKVIASYKQVQLEKDTEIAKLKFSKSIQNVKQTGENLESWCNEEILSYMQNGLYNCTWIKDNVVVKNDGEVKGSKADFIFNIYATEEHNENELLANVCMDMKDENPESVNKHKNEDYYSALDKNRTKKNCKYALLVSNLELDKVNISPIFRVLDYPDMYVVRPAYLMTFLNILTSITLKFKNLYIVKEAEREKFKSIDALNNLFEDLKKTYLDKPLEQLQKQINDISDGSEAIKKAVIKIDNACDKITLDYISKIVDKLEKFNIKKIEKDLNKIENI